jgi:hypothetical protein
MEQKEFLPFVSFVTFAVRLSEEVIGQRIRNK